MLTVNDLKSRQISPAVQPPREPGKAAPPALDDDALYFVKTGVPILKVHTYKERKTINGQPKTIVREIDEARLNLIVDNSNRRAENGDYGLLFLGHTDDDKPEEQQPEIVGYSKNYRVGEWAGKPCILADFFIEKARKSEVMTYPRRSAETWYHDTEPERNYIDAVSLLRRTPEQDLGLLTFSRSEGTKLRFAAIEDDQPDEGDMGLSEDDYAKIGEIISTSLKTGLESLSDMLSTTIQHAVKTVLDGAAQEGEPDGDEGALEQNEEAKDDEGTSEDDEPSSDDAEAPPATDDEESSKEKNEAGSTPSGSNTSVPDDVEDKGKEKMCADPETMDDEKMQRNRRQKDSDNITLARYGREITELKGEVEKLRGENATLQRNARQERRERELVQLQAEGFEIDRNEELSDGERLDDAAWAKHIGKIRARYSRKPIDADEVPVSRERPDAPGEEKELTAEEAADFRSGLLKFQKEHAGKYKDPVELIEAYKGERAAKKAAKA